MPIIFWPSSTACTRETLNLSTIQSVASEPVKQVCRWRRHVSGFVTRPISRQDGKKTRTNEAVVIRAQEVSPLLDVNAAGERHKDIIKLQPPPQAHEMVVRRVSMHNIDARRRCRQACTWSDEILLFSPRRSLSSSSSSHSPPVKSTCRAVRHISKALNAS